MIDPKDLDYCALDKTDYKSENQLTIADLPDLKIKWQAEVLEWAMSLCSTGMTISMIHAKLSERLKLINIEEK